MKSLALSLPIVLLSSLFLSAALAADKPVVGEKFGEQKSPGKDNIRHSFLITGKSTAILDENSVVTWTIPSASRDGFVLPNGNVLVSTNNEAREYAPAKDNAIVWSYKMKNPNRELGTVVRLENGNTLAVERGPKPRLLEISPEGKIELDLPLKPETDNAHMQTRMARKLPNGNYLVPHLLAFKINEYNAAGEIVRTIPTDLPELGGRKAEPWPFTAIRLSNGNTLSTLTHGNQVVEFDKEGAVTWHVTNQETGNRLADPCGAQRLPNGNTVICSYGQKNGKMPKAFEIDSRMSTVWEYHHPTVRIHEIHVLTTNGEPVGSPLK